MLHYHSFTFNAFQENTFLIWNDAKEAVIIDPGCYEAYEEAELKSFIERNQLKPKAIWNTHGHIDHVLGIDFVKHSYRIPFFLHSDDSQTLKAGEVIAPVYGFERYKPVEPDQDLKGITKLSLGELEFEVLFVPGHCPGHVAFYHLGTDGKGYLFSGDVLFSSSIGRTDLPGGSFDVLEKSLLEKVYVLPGETKVLCGHGESTTVGHEKFSNPFVRFNP